MNWAQPKPAIITPSKTRICVGLERYGDFTSWSKADDLLEALATVGVGFEVDVEGGPCDIILRNTESVFHPPVTSQSSPSFDTPVILFDSYDITHLPMPIVKEAAKPEVKAYLRSSTFRDVSTYFRQAQGGSYYNHVLSSSMNGLSPDVTPRLLDERLEKAVEKIIVCNPVLPFMTDQRLEFIDIIHQLLLEDRHLDILLNDWHTLDHQVKLLEPQRYGLNTTTMKELFPDGIPDTLSHGIHYILYLATLSNTKVLVSPWGPAGFSKMDFEALLCGAIVVKPECSNIRTWVDIYDPLHGYVQYCSPDLSDLRDVVLYIVNNIDEYAGIAHEAREVLRQHYAPANNAVASWLDSFRVICENVLKG